MNNQSEQRSVPALTYNPQLDGLRCFAVLFVCAYHWSPSIAHVLNVNFGGLINFFFVLSSYLITRILFSANAKGDALKIPKLKVMGVFLLRRSIRIFPAYYFYLLLLLISPIGQEVRDHTGMYFSYLSNYRIFDANHYCEGTAHLWTLAVEEQFYLLWPFCIFFIPQRHLLKSLVFIVVLCVSFKALFYTSGTIVPQAILTEYCIDAFAIGGLLAYKTITSPEENAMIDRYFNRALLLLLPLGIIAIILKSRYHEFVINRLLFSMISMKIIEGAVKGYKNFFGKILENKTVINIGRISYGIYLYHLIVPMIFWKFYEMGWTYLKTSHNHFFQQHINGLMSADSVVRSQPVLFLLFMLITFVLAMLSWRLVEAPFNKLKIQYNYNREVPQRTWTGLRLRKLLYVYTRKNGNGRQ